MSDESKKQKKEMESAKSKNHTSIHKIVVLVGLLIILIIAIIGGTMLVSYQEHQQSNVQKLKMKFAELQDSNLSTQTDVAKLSMQIDSQDKLLQHLQEKAGKQDIDWVLAEVNYLVRLASFDLQFNQNTQEAMLLLHTADQRLASLKDPRLLLVRQSLANDMAKLKAVPKVDAEGILLQLNAMSSQVTNLPIIATPEDVQKQGNKHHHHHHKDTPTWKIHLEESWRQIRELVVVQYHDQPVGQMITPSNRNYLDMHLQLLLAQAQWAVIHNQEKVFKHSLLEAQVWVRNYYVESSPKTHAMINSLQTLVAIDIKPELPDVSDSIDALTKVKNKFNKQDDSKATAVTGVDA